MTLRGPALRHGYGHSAAVTQESNYTKVPIQMGLGILLPQEKPQFSQETREMGPPCRFATLDCEAASTFDGSKIAVSRIRLRPTPEGDVMPEPGKSAADAQPRPDPNEKLVKVFDSEQEPEALVVKGLLDSAGIDSDLTSASLVQDAFPGLGGMILLVREEDADEARRVIAEGRRSAPDDETAEIQVIEEPPPKA